MITVGMNYEVLEGKEGPFEKKFAAVLDVMGQTTGHKDTQLFRSVARSRSYLIVSEWDSRTAFDSFIQSEDFRNVTNWGKEHILAGRPTHQIYGDDPGLKAATEGGHPVH